MASRSAQACIACRTHKRRCDKLLPDCSLCLRMNRACVYNVGSKPLPTVSEWHAVRARLEALESRMSSNETTPSAVTGSGQSQTLASSSTVISSPPDTGLQEVSVCGLTLPGDSTCHVGEPVAPRLSPHEEHDASLRNRVPSSLFLDIDCFVWSHARLPTSSGSIPASVLALLSRENILMDISVTYISTIHTWLPIVSKKRLDMGLSIRNAGSDLAMLFLAMWLITTPPTEGTLFEMYQEAKQFLARLEADGSISLLVLQGMVLIALFEYGHAIYPAAWMTVGACARYSEMLSYVPGDFGVLGQVTTWTESEERRRTWWSVFLLDKLVALGGRRQCAIPEPHAQARLPVDDDLWDNGEVSRAVGYSANTPYQTPQGGFARLCQASIYLGRAIQLSRRDPTTPDIAGVTTLISDLNGLAVILDSAAQGDAPLPVPSSIIRSALFVALDRFTCPEKLSFMPGYNSAMEAKSSEELDIQLLSMSLVEQASQKIHLMSMNLLPLIQSSRDEAERMHSLSVVSPFIMDAVYAGAATFHWSFGENGKETYRKAAEEMQMLLDVLNSRWRLGSAYQQMMVMHDVTKRGTASPGSLSHV